MTGSRNHEYLNGESGDLWNEFYGSQARTLFDYILSTVHEGINKYKESARTIFEQYPIRDIPKGQGDFSKAASYKIIIRINTFAQIDGINPTKIVVELPKGLLVPTEDRTVDSLRDATEVSKRMAMGAALILVDDRGLEVSRLFATTDSLFRYEKEKNYIPCGAIELTDEEAILEEDIDLNGDDQTMGEIKSIRFDVVDETGKRVEVPVLSLEEANEIVGQVLEALKYSTVQDQSPD